MRRAVGIDDMAGLEDGVEALGANLRARHHCGNFLFFDYLPIDKFLDIRMVQVQTDHFGRTAGGPSGLDGASRSIPDAEKRHEPGRASAARSEEHTSELQSLAYLVCRLLRENKAHSRGELPCGVMPDTASRAELTYSTH